MPPKILILAGEESGDGHGAELVRALKTLRPDIEIEAWGGRRLAQAGARVHEDLVAHAVMGLFPVLVKIPFFFGVLRRVLARIRGWQPDLVIPIDYPGLNLRISRRARRLGARVLYYVSPQVWAWWRSRVKRVGRAIDKMLVLFPFEVDLYRERGVAVEYVGHPLLDALACEPRDEGFRARHRIGPDEPVVALLPGSRQREIKKLLPLFLDAAVEIRAARPTARFVLAAARPAFVETARRLAAARGLDVTVLDGEAHAVMREARVALVASGTATLECLALSLPMVIAYRVSWLSWLGAQLILATPHIGLANIICGERAVPEHFDWRDRPAALAADAIALFDDGEARARCLERLAGGRAKLGEPGASERAARAALAMIGAAPIPAAATTAAAAAPAPAPRGTTEAAAG